jgi:hypothetical protein
VAKLGRLESPVRRGFDRMPPRILCLLWCVFLAAAAAPEAAAAAAQQQLVEVFEVERRTEGTRAHQCANN